MLGLGVQQGHRIRVTIDGEDEATAAATIRAVVEAGLDERLEGAGPDGAHG